MSKKQGIEKGKLMKQMKKLPVEVVIEDNMIAVRCAGGQWLKGALDNRWLWVLGAIAFPEEHKLKISDLRTNREDHQKDMSCLVPDNKKQEFSVRTPEGYLIVQEKGSEDDYPGVQISFTKDNDPSSQKSMVACVEYESTQKELRTEIYQDGYNEPVHIIRYEDGIDVF